MTSNRRSTLMGALSAAAVALALLSGCGEAAESTAGGADAGTGIRASDLMGTWRTADLPRERVRGVFIAAGGSEAQADEFLALSGSRRTVAYALQVEEDLWAQLAHNDGGGAVTGTLGTWSLEGDVVRAVERGHGSCWIDYRLALDGSELTVTVVDLQESPQCESEEGQAIQRTIFESAPFTRVE